MAKFITFEGVEGSGKTTQVLRTGEWLRSAKIPCLVTSEPGGSILGKELRSLLLDRTSLKIGERAELLLFAADRAQHVDEVVIPALNEEKVVICDRFSDATIAYQGSGRGLDLNMIEAINAFASFSIKPDVTLLFDLPVHVGLKRVADRTLGPDGAAAVDRFEREQADFHQKVREAYRRIAEKEPRRFRIIDASQDADTVFLEVSRSISEILGI